MAKLESVFRDTIARGTRRQVRLRVLPMRREVLRLRRRLTEVERTLTTLRRSAALWERRMNDGPPVAVSEDEARSARLSPRLVQSLRKRLGMSQMALARLVGVSAPAVAHWEAGNSAPKGPHRAALVGLRRVGKREAKALLAQRIQKMASRKPRPHGRRQRRRRRKKK